MKFLEYHNNDTKYLIPESIYSWILIDLGNIPEYEIIQRTLEIVLLRNGDQKSNGTFIDCGAHCGFWTLTLAKSFSKVYSFEPCKETFNALCGGIAINDYNNIERYNVAVGNLNQIGQKQLNIVSSGDGGGNSLYNYLNTPIKNTESIWCNILDNYKYEGNVSLIKIDVEGNELETLQGAKNLIEKYKPVLIIEIWNQESYLSQKLKVLNYLKEINYNYIRLNHEMHLCTSS